MVNDARLVQPENCDESIDVDVFKNTMYMPGEHNMLLGLMLGSRLTLGVMLGSILGLTLGAWLGLIIGAILGLILGAILGLTDGWILGLTHRFIL